MSLCRIRTALTPPNEINPASIEPLPKYLDAIRDFPMPKSTTNIRSWFGLVNQVANYAQLRDIMAPFNPFLSPKQQFSWTEELDKAFEISKQSIIEEIRHGVEIFDPTKQTCLRPDWSPLVLVLVYTQEGSLWSIVLRCDDHTGIFTCDGCARDPYFYVPAETQSYVIKLSCSRKVLAASGD